MKKYRFIIESERVSRNAISCDNEIILRFTISLPVVLAPYPFLPGALRDKLEICAIVDKNSVYNFISQFSAIYCLRLSFVRSRTENVAFSSFLCQLSDVRLL